MATSSPISAVSCTRTRRAYPPEEPSDLGPLGWRRPLARCLDGPRPQGAGIRHPRFVGPRPGSLETAGGVGDLVDCDVRIMPGEGAQEGTKTVAVSQSRHLPDPGNRGYRLATEAARQSSWRSEDLSRSKRCHEARFDDDGARRRAAPRSGDSAIVARRLDTSNRPWSRSAPVPSIRVQLLLGPASGTAPGAPPDLGPEARRGVPSHRIPLSLSAPARARSLDALECPAHGAPHRCGL